jgi:hypothetical protein
VWFFNGYYSPAAPRRVAEDYAMNAVLMSALLKNSKKKLSNYLMAKPGSVVANYRQDLSTGVPWILGQGLQSDHCGTREQRWPSLRGQDRGDRVFFYHFERPQARGDC